MGATLNKNRPLSGNGDHIPEMLLACAPLLQAFLECSTELQPHARKMLAVLTSPESEHDDRMLAAMTLADVLLPNRGDDGHIGLDLEESEAIGASHSPEARETLEQMDREEAVFADRLRDIMERKGVTQVQIAEKLGVGQPAISNMLQRQCRPQRRTVIRLAEALGVSPTDLWPGFGVVEG
jgi:lambda repressor-like predicted transcriptional regulator